MSIFYDQCVFQYLHYSSIAFSLSNTLCSFSGGDWMTIQLSKLGTSEDKKVIQLIMNVGKVV